MSNRDSELFGGGRIRIDRHARAVVVDGRSVKLSGRAFDLLRVLIERSPRVVPKQELLDVVWPGLVVEENNLQVHVMNLRKVLGAEAIVTVSGRGYQFGLQPDAPPRPRPDVIGSPPLERAPEVTTSDLIGRDLLISRTCALLRRPDARLVTLTGPGGSGKTRLALNVTAKLNSEFEHGTYVVMLAPVRDAAHVMPAIAAVLNLRESGSRSMSDLVVAHLRDREVLLALDNFEHVTAAASAIARLLETCPRLKVLVTSRALLRVPAERSVLVPPLDLPAPDADHAATLRAPAVQLLIERAQRVGRRVGEQRADIEAAAEICRRLDGLPLAIELAAARLRVLSMTELSKRLGNRLKLLNEAKADAPARQRTLRDTIAWTHALLPLAAQALFRRLAVFAGGWSLDAAELVANAGSVRESVVDLLSTLLDHNLVQRVDDVDADARFTMLVTVREYALECLEESGEAVELRVRHARHFARLARTLEPRLRTGGRGRSIARMKTEYNNLRAAMSWLILENPDPEEALDIVGTLPWLWYFTGQFSEGRAWIAMALELPGVESQPGEARARLWSGAARLATYAGDAREAFASAERAVQAFRRSEHQYDLALALMHRGIACSMMGEFQAGHSSFREARSIFEKAEDEWGIAFADTYDGCGLAIEGLDDTEAERAISEGRARFLALADDWGVTTSSHYLGTLALRRKDFSTARSMTEEMLRSARELGDNYRVSRNLHQLAQIAFAEGNYDLALEHLAASMLLTREQGRIGDLAVQLRLLARIEAARGSDDSAVRLYGAASRLEAKDVTIQPADDPGIHEELLATMRARMSDRSFQSEWTVGRTMPLDDVLAWAMNRRLAATPDGSAGTPLRARG